MSPNSEELDLDLVKHPLERPWAIWLFTNEIKSKKNWHLNLKKVAHFDTVEDYWCLYHHMKLPSELRQGQDYAVFVDGVSPTWEHAANKAGGRWLVHLERGAEPMDRYWGDAVLLMIGENFGAANDIISGAVVNVRERSRSKVAVWTRTTEKGPNMAIARTIKELLGIQFKLQFCKHNTNTVLYTC